MLFNFAFFLLSQLVVSAPSNDVVVTDIDILMTKQTWGECRRDLSVDGNKLRIKGVEYSSGIGTHATSMIPVTVPSNAQTLSGACGIDDEVSSLSSVVFSVLSGSEVLWTSGVLRNGDAAKTFTVTIPAGSTKLYLLADEYDLNQYDHADWVDLHWDNTVQTKADGKAKLSIHYFDRISNTITKKIRRNNKIYARSYGLVPNEFEDQGPKLRKMITMARATPGTTIFLEKGEYHFYETGALKMSYHVSNHDQPTFQPVCVPLVDLNGVTIDGSGSTFVFHNLVEPFLIMDSTDVTIQNVHIDSYRPLYTDAVVTDADYFSTTVRIDKDKFPYQVQNKNIIFVGEGFTVNPKVIIPFDPTTRHILPESQGIVFSGAVVENDDGTVTFAQNLKKYGVQAGTLLTIRSYDRPHPGFVLYRATRTTLNNVQIHDSLGMGLLAQRSTDITIVDSQVTYGSSTRAHSASCDATHFSNTRGLIKVTGCLFEAMLDDAINVHCTSLKIVEVINNSCVKLQYMHGQAVGFETFLPGEKIQFIRARTMELSEIRTVKSVRKLSTTLLYVEIEGTLPSDIAVNDAVENADYYPEVHFENNIVRNNIARGCLFTTPLQVRVIDNVFDHISGSAILLAGDAANWFESGGCKDVLISGNRVINALTSIYQFTNAVFSFYPTISDVKSQKTLYHRNVKIVNNSIETFDCPLLFAISTDTIYIGNNTINYNNDYKAWGQKTFQLQTCRNVTLEDNLITPEKKWSIDDFSLDNTDESEVHIN